MSFLLDGVLVQVNLLHCLFSVLISFVLLLIFTGVKADVLFPLDA
jgi:hypothetical protein